MPPPQLSRIEAQLGRAHRALWEAASEAESLRDQSLAEDLYMLVGEIGRINLALSGGKNPRKHLTTPVRI